MKKASRKPVGQTLAILVAICFGPLGVDGISAQQAGPASPPRPPAAYINLINATGLPGEVAIDLNGDPNNASALSMGSVTGLTEVPAGSVSVKISHPKCAGPQEQKFTLKTNDRLNLVVHASVGAGENGAAPPAKLVLLPLQHLPSPGKNTLSLLNCDALGRSQSLALNGTAYALNPLQPLHITELVPAENYVLTSNGAEVMAPYEPLTADHAYLIVYLDLENPRLNGILVTDRKPGTVEEEMDLRKKEVAQKIERERKAAEWVLKELDRKTQERTEARAKRQKERAAELKR